MTIYSSNTEQDELLLKNIPLVRYIARGIQYHLPPHVEIDDLISAGTMGLLDASRKYDASRNVSFRIYASPRIRGAIIDGLRTQDWGSRSVRRKGRAIDEAIHSLNGRLGRKPTESDIACEMGVPLAEYQQLMRVLEGLKVFGIQTEYVDDPNYHEQDFVPQCQEEDTLSLCIKNEMREVLKAAISVLPKNERLVLTMYYGEEKTMDMISKALNVCPSRITQLHQSAIQHLRYIFSEQQPGYIRKYYPSIKTILAKHRHTCTRKLKLCKMHSPLV